ncbi:hypothetical protein H310_04844 [Aphanomyces invadans]|uniref:F-box domain-containing protein n=1 Tax=Aphanomyces invadans TaxID=157072 RepID=A0A024UCJ8_9STRA|nr:hypothetical protein H310_04844 [Aphanomyces invadans]ETW03353.1 hypothetical protein H310_04844 [Aphanomyces invadans]|eukprot:XP_008867582.1 hypothetical protein H310_04844 [Aphanomyces invadans]
MPLHPSHELPNEVLEITFVYLDSAALGQLTKTCRAIRHILQTSRVWKTQLHARFGVVVEAFPAQPSWSWRAIFANLMWDVSSLGHAFSSPEDVLSVVDKPPLYAMDAAATSIRVEILLMEGLRRFPTSDSMLTSYAALVRPPMSTPLAVF